MATKAKPKNTTKNAPKKKQETNVLNAINKVNTKKEVENLVKAPEVEPEEVKTESQIIISEANEILGNTENIEEQIDEKRENIEKIVETEIKKVEKVIEKGKKVLKKHNNNSEAFTDFWNGAAIF